MIPDPNLVNVKRVLDVAAILSWVLLGVAVLALVGYIVFSGLYGTALAARVPVFIVLVAINVSAVFQVIFANAAPKAFPAERGLRLKAIIGIAAPGLLGVILWGITSLVVRLTVGVYDAIAQNFVFGCFVIVCAPLTGFLYDSGRQLLLVEKKYGLEGAAQLYRSQRAS